MTTPVTLDAGAPAPPLRLIGLSHPFSTAERIDLELPAGESVAELIVHAGMVLPDGIIAHVFIDDWLVPRELWPRVRPKPGRLVTVRAVPGFGGGGGGGRSKNPLRIILSIAILAAGVALGGAFGPALGTALGFTGELAGVVGSGIIQGAVGIIGGLVTSALSSQPTRSFDAPQLPRFGAAEASSPTYSLVGAVNDYGWYQPIAAVMGRHKITCRYAAQWYTELHGNDQYLVLLFTAGIGPVAFSEHKLGDTAIEEFEDVEIQERQGYPGEDWPTLFPNAVVQKNYQIQLTLDDGWRRLTSPLDADELGIEITCPRLTFFYGGGGRREETVELAIRWSPVGEEDWTDEPNLVITDNSTSAVRRSHRWATGATGQYDIEIKRLTADSDSDQLFNDTYWTAIRAFRHQPPVLLDTMSAVAMKLKASGQLSGQHPPYTVVATRIAPDWDVATETWIERQTRSPAAAVRWMLQGPATKSPRADSKIDLATFAAWSEGCEAKGLHFDAVYDFETVERDVLRDVCAIGRAKPTIIDSKFSVIRDVDQASPVAVLSPRNSFGFRGKRIFKRLPHALIVWFINADKGYVRDYVVVYRDGFDGDTATEFDEYTAFGVTSGDKAWKDGRRRMAEAELRPEEFRVGQDMEYLTASRGDRVDLSHDVILVGLAWGRVKSVTTDGEAAEGQQLVGVVLDEVCPMEAGNSYAVVITGPVEADRTLAVVTVPGETNALTFQTPQDEALIGQEVIAKGYLATFGVAGKETLACVLRDVVAGRHLTAELTLLDLAPAIQTADDGPIPDYDSGITRPPEIYPARPATPVIVSVDSDESVLLPAPGGGWQPQIIATLGARSGDTLPIAATQRQIRLQGGQDWHPLPDLPGAALDVPFSPVEQRQAYDLRIRVVTGPTAQHVGNSASDWATVTAHTVVGKTTLPPPPVNLERVNNRAVWKYPDKPRDFDGFLVRTAAGITTVPGTAATAHDGLLSGAEFDLTPLLGAGVRTLFVVAVDTDGNRSATAARMVLNLGDPAIDNVVDVSTEAPDWSGTLAGGSVVGDELRADGLNSWWTGVDGASLWTGVDSHKTWAPRYGVMTYLWGYTAAEAAQLTLSVDLDAPQGWTLDYRRGLNALAWSGNDAATWWSGVDTATRWQGVSGDWHTWPGALTAEAGLYDFRTTTAAGAGEGVVRQAAVTLDVADEEETVEDLVLDAGGTRVPLAKTYRSIRMVRVTLQGGSDAVKVEVVDRSTVGPLLQGLDAANEGAAANVLVEIKGVKAAV